MSELKDKAFEIDVEFNYSVGEGCNFGTIKERVVKLSDAQAEIDNVIADVNAECSRRTENEMNRLQKEVTELKVLLARVIDRSSTRNMNPKELKRFTETMKLEIEQKLKQG